ncbi:serine hydrolase domain-containing protein [Actinomadura sp. 6N118]|uniref:serine hydrolase domain-containing protein n=1 Tax=Actinomadura sp. 6N118 TaxID=3375151 RepID=UPI003788EDA6
MRVRTAFVAVTVATAVLAAPAVPGSAAVDHRSDLQRSLDAIVAAGAVGAQAEAVGPHGRWRGVAGTARLGEQKPVPEQGRFRIGSTTKTFTATVLLQLVAEKKVGLDAPIERYLPGLVPNGDHITVRQLLNHTSGLREYLEDTETLPMDGDAFLAKVRYATWAPKDLVRLSTKRPPYFPPGTDWHYSNTNYVLAGLIIEKVTGRSYATEVRRRIVQPLGLRHTYLPGTRTGIRGPHAHGYLRFVSNGQAKTVDVTRLNPSWGWAAGEIVSTTGDLNRFFDALLGGRLLPPAQLAQMRTTVPTPSPDGSADGLGMGKIRLSCGVTAWGKDGGIQGFSTQSLHSADGRRHISLSVTLPEFYGPGFPKIWDAIQQTATKALCSK